MIIFEKIKTVISNLTQIGRQGLNGLIIAGAVLIALESIFGVNFGVSTNLLKILGKVGITRQYLTILSVVGIVLYFNKK